MDMGWKPSECIPCEYRRECTTCFNDVDNLRQINRDSIIPRIWRLFKTAISVSTFDMDMGYNLLGVQQILQTESGILDCDPDDFWSAMSYFLNRTNQKHHASLVAKGYFKNKK